MSFKNETECRCDWCRDRIESGDDVACGDCYKILEQRCAELEARVRELEEELDEDRKEK